MAIRKKGSRFKDRNTIRRMHRAGYSLEQISGKTSIAIEHVEYVIEKWDEDAEKAKSQSLIARQRAAEVNQAMRAPAGNSVTLSERDQIKAELRREIMAELDLRKQETLPFSAPAKVPAKEAPVEEAPVEEAPVEEAPVEEGVKRRKRKVLPDSDDADDPDVNDGGP
jgi:hypothetical protein